ncbi:MAG: SEC-C domain-containing protein [Gammaproteobacteria bacterium]|nr:SEC-C domain-containing protein [Gammaproteobacteria bacterium]NVK89538.1 SEC-C domain-containing protein [Gammaproteobacteria bacterium]
MGAMQSCYCDQNLPFEQCCAPFIRGEQNAPSAVALMRSRYSAYCVAAGDYLYNTYHSTRRADLSPGLLAATAREQRWIRLEIQSTQAVAADSAEVEFKAFQLEGDYLLCLHERSTFYREDGQWRYHSGVIYQQDAVPVKIGRNDACPCHSGKKYKRCCAGAKT